MQFKKEKEKKEKKCLFSYLFNLQTLRAISSFHITSTFATSAHYLIRPLKYSRTAIRLPILSLNTSLSLYTTQLTHCLAYKFHIEFSSSERVENSECLLLISFHFNSKGNFLIFFLIIYLIPLGFCLVDVFGQMLCSFPFLFL